MRELLLIVASVTGRYEPDFTEFRKRLAAKGKPARVCLAAVLRVLLKRETISDLTWILAHRPSLATCLATLALIWQMCSVWVTHNADAGNRRFEAYHRLIKEIVEPSKTGNTYVDRQCAAVYELRRFTSYRELTKRLLTGLQEDWHAAGIPVAQRLACELEMTLAFLEK